MMHQVFFRIDTMKLFSWGQTWNISFTLFYIANNNFQVIQSDLFYPQALEVTNNLWVRVTFSSSQRGHNRRIARLMKIYKFKGYRTRRCSRSLLVQIWTSWEKWPPNMSTLQWFGLYSGQPEIESSRFKMSSIYVSVSSVSFKISRKLHRNHLHLLGGKKFPPLSKPPELPGEFLVDLAFSSPVSKRNVLLGWHPLNTFMDPK